MDHVLFQKLINRIAEKKRADGDKQVTLSDLEKLCQAVVDPPKPAYAPGYPKEVYRQPPDATPWVPKAIPVPERRWVASPEEELQAAAEGFASSWFNRAPMPGYPRMITRPSADPTQPSRWQLVSSPEEEDAVKAQWEREERNGKR